MSTQSIDHITMFTGLEINDSAVEQVKGRAEIGWENYPLQIRAKFIGHARKTGGGSGWVKVHDWDNDTIMGTLEVTSSTPVPIEIALSNIPASRSLLELIIYTDDTGIIQVTGAVVEVY